MMSMSKVVPSEGGGEPALEFPKNPQKTLAFRKQALVDYTSHVFESEGSRSEELRRLRSTLFSSIIYDAFRGQGAEAFASTGVRRVKLFETQYCHAAALYCPMLQATVVVFRGTASGSDMRTNFSFRLSYLDGHPMLHGKGFEAVRVHGGYLRTMQTVSESLDQEVKRIAELEACSRLVICGHSLGAAQSLLYSLQTAGRLSDGRLVPEYVGVACPRAGGGRMWEYAEALKEAGLMQWEVIEHPGDMIPCLPPNLMRTVLTLGLNFCVNSDLLLLYRYTQATVGRGRLIVSTASSFPEEESLKYDRHTWGAELLPYEDWRKTSDQDRLPKGIDKARKTLAEMITSPQFFIFFFILGSKWRLFLLTATPSAFALLITTTWNPFAGGSDEEIVNRNRRLTTTSTGPVLVLIEISIIIFCYLLILFAVKFFTALIETYRSHGIDGLYLNGLLTTKQARAFFAQRPLPPNVKPDSELAVVYRAPCSEPYKKHLKDHRRIGSVLNRFEQSYWKAHTELGPELFPDPVLQKHSSFRRQVGPIILHTLISVALITAASIITSFIVRPEPRCTADKTVCLTKRCKDGYSLFVYYPDVCPNAFLNRTICSPDTPDLIGARRYFFAGVYVDGTVGAGPGGSAGHDFFALMRKDGKCTFERATNNVTAQFLTDQPEGRHVITQNVCVRDDLVYGCPVPSTPPPPPATVSGYECVRLPYGEYICTSDGGCPNGLGLADLVSPAQNTAELFSITFSPEYGYPNLKEPIDCVYSKLSHLCYTDPDRIFGPKRDRAFYFRARDLNSDDPRLLDWKLSMDRESGSCRIEPQDPRFSSARNRICTSNIAAPSACPKTLQGYGVKYP